ncbi:MAG TPA: transporter substrate-binding domain-containing protein [Spirochaetota bacterium]|nr:transporter substrate-binding domain-containing protein [Spirochaetota bacterium]
MKKNIFFVFCLLTLSVIYLNSRDLIIGGKPSEQSRWFDEKSGKFTGFDVEIVDYIFKKLGVTYKIVLESSSTRLEYGWENEEPFYDMVFTYSKKKEREKFLIYATESHINIEWNFFIRKEDEGKYKFETFEDLRGLRIGYTKGQAYTEEFMKAMEKGICIGDEVVKDELQLTKLLNGRIDMVPLSTSTTLYKAQKEGFRDKISYLPKPIKSEPYYNTFVRKSNYPDLLNLIKRYDEVLTQMKKDGTLKQITEKYGK